MPKKKSEASLEKSRREQMGRVLREHERRFLGAARPLGAVRAQAAAAAEAQRKRVN